MIYDSLYTSIREIFIFNILVVVALAMIFMMEFVCIIGLRYKTSNECGCEREVLGLLLVWVDVIVLLV